MIGSGLPDLDVEFEIAFVVAEIAGAVVDGEEGAAGFGLGDEGSGLSGAVEQAGGLGGAACGAVAALSAAGLEAPADRPHGVRDRDRPRRGVRNGGTPFEMG